MSTSNTVLPSQLWQRAAKLGRGKPALAAWVSQDAMAGLTFSRLGFDVVTFDLQHGRQSPTEVQRALTVVTAAGVPVAVRVPVGDFPLASRMLDAGASLIIAPMVNSAEEARRFVSYCKYPPLGERSWGPFGALPLSGLTQQQFLEQANGCTTTLAMIETAAALAALDEILAVPGLDGLLIGPVDLSIALSAGKTIDADSEAVRRARERVLAACTAAGKIAGIYCGSGEGARSAAAQGFGFIVVGSDTIWLTAGASQALATARG